MPEKEFYRLEIGIGVTGTEKTKSELKAMERFVEQTRKRGEMLNRMRISPTVRLIDRISGPARRIEANLNRLSGVHRVTIEAMDRTTNVVRRITGALTSPLTMLGAGAGMAGLIGYPLKLAGEMDRAQNSILNYSASIEEGRKNFEELVAFALKSPVYDVPFVAQMGGRLLAITKDINFTKRALEAFGNSMLFTGASLDDVKFAFRGFQQIASKGKLQMEELYQVTENLNIPLQWVQDQLGITGDQLSDLGRLGIPARRAMEGIVRVLETRFPKANFNEDLLALATNIKETSRTVLWYFGQGMKPAFLRILQDITGALDPTGRKFEVFAERVKLVGGQVGEKFEGLYGSMKKFFNTIASDEAFQRADWGGKLGILLDRTTDVVLPKAGQLGFDVGMKLGAGVLEGLEAAIVENRLLSLFFGAYVGAKAPGPLPVKMAVTLSIFGGTEVARQKSSVKQEIERIGGPTRQIYESLEKTGGGRGGGTAGVGMGILMDKLGFIKRGTLLEPSLGNIRALESLERKYPDRYATGGIFTRPRLGFFAEAGPEALIPLSSRMRSRALDLWQRTGEYLGVKPYALGGFAEPVLAVAGVDGGGGATVVNIYLDGAVKNTITVEAQGDIEKVADETAAVIAKKIKTVFQNMP